MKGALKAFGHRFFKFVTICPIDLEFDGSESFFGDFYKIRFSDDKSGVHHPVEHVGEVGRIVAGHREQFLAGGADAKANGPDEAHFASAKFDSAHDEDDSGLPKKQDVCKMPREIT